MTNEEYINIVIERATMLLPLMKPRLGDSVDGYIGFFKKLMSNMADWKDQQFKEILKEECNTSYESGLSEGERKAEVRFKEYLEKKKAEHKEGQIGYYIFNEIINELFGED